MLTVRVSVVSLGVDGKVLEKDSGDYRPTV